MRDFLHKMIPVVGSLLLTVNAFAADVRMSVEPQLIGLLDRTVLHIEFSNVDPESVDIPEIEGLTFKRLNPMQHISFIQGQSNAKITHRYLITPSKVGDYTIAPVTCKYKGGEKVLSTQLRVIKPEDDKEAQALSKLLYARISTDTAEPYVHQPFELTLKLFIRDGIQITGGFNIVGGIPESGLDGQLGNWTSSPRQRKEIEGKIFNIYTLHTTISTLTAGNFRFQPEVQINRVVPRQDYRPFGFEDAFFGDPFGRQEVRPTVLDCNPLDVTVQSIPMERRPKSYTGGVGVFEFDVDVGPAEVKAGEPVTVKMRITGHGNINQITPPVLEERHDLKLYEVRTLPTENPNEVVFEQVVIPRSDTATEVPAIAFSYFNSQTSDFRTLKKGPFPIEVEAVPQQAAQLISTAPSAIQQETKVLGRDIVYLKSAPKIWRTGQQAAWHQTRLFYPLLALPALLLLIVGKVTANRNALANDVARARRQKAPKAARRNIQLAEHAMRKHDEAAFNEALWNAVADYFGHRLNLSPGDVTLQTVLSHMPQQAEALESLFTTIEHRRYALNPDSTSKAEMKELLRQLAATLKQCERIRL